MNHKFIIRLEDLRFFARIGVDAQERTVGNDFRVDLRIVTDADNFQTENVYTVISYADVYEIVEWAMKQQWLLIESAAKAIHTRIYEKWPGKIFDISVKITKLTPPIKGIQGSASVEYI